MMLEISNLNAGYGDLKVLFDVSMHMDEGEVVSLVGSNGAGKTTLLRIISGLEKVKSGTVMFDGVDLIAQKKYARAELGIAHIPQGRGILNRLTVKENLMMGAYHKSARANMHKHIEAAYERFPILRERQNQIAGQLSGGEQQMLAICRALAMEPKLIMMDEPSLGLAPIYVQEVFEIIKQVSQEGISILVVEQNLYQALSVADRGYVLETGRIVMEGKASDLINKPEIQSAYLGI